MLSRTPFVAAVVVALASAATLFELIGRVELTFDEAYYTLWSRHLAWGYFDHPPMIALWIRASTAIFGDGEAGVRALGVMLYAFVPALIGVMAWRLYDCPLVGAYAALAWLAMPMSAGAALVTPDAPLTFFSALALAGLIEAYRGSRLGWPMIGVALGLALQSKFTALFLCAGVALAVVALPALRRRLVSPTPYAAAALAALIYAPFAIWNATHGWATFVKQFARVPAHGFAPGYLLEFLAAQFGLANPLLMIAGGTIFRPVNSADGDRRRLLSAYLAPAIVYFVIHALHDRVQGNWTAPLFPALAIMAGQAAKRGPIWARRVARLGIALGALAIALVYLHAATDWPELGSRDPMARIGGWRELTRRVDAKAQAESAAYLLARGYAATSLLTFYGDGATPVVQSGEPERWIFAPPLVSSIFNGPGLAIGEADRGEESLLASKFRTVERLGSLWRKRGAVDVEEFEVFRVADPIGDPREGN